MCDSGAKRLSGSGRVVVSDRQAHNIFANMVQGRRSLVQRGKASEPRPDPARRHHLVDVRLHPLPGGAENRRFCMLSALRAHTKAP
jgi:hypothetical protein